MKKVLFIAIPVGLLGGVAAAGKLGILQIPGLSPAKKAGAASLYSQDKEKSAETKPAAQPRKRKPPTPAVRTRATDVPRENPESGYAKIAGLWNEMSPDALLAIAKTWKDADLAPIFHRMDGDKVAKMLETMAQADPNRASSLVRAIQKEAAKPVAPADAS